METTVNHTTTVELTQELIQEPPSNFIDYLKDKTGHIDHYCTCESEPKSVLTVNHLSFLRSTMPEIQNLLTIARHGELRKSDLLYLNGKLSGMAIRNYKTLLKNVHNRQDFNNDIISKIEDILINTNDTMIKKHLLDILVNRVEKGIRKMPSLTNLEDNVLEPNTCLATRYLFLRASTNQRLSSKPLLNLTIVSVNKSGLYKSSERQNCILALYSSLKIQNIAVSWNMLNKLEATLLDQNTESNKPLYVSLLFVGRFITQYIQ
ncbi:unnamed protein product [Didymodactylos carnosus]|uniref:Uncharacterized protein n=1 Tax=Didymodactylos carnosus TaxID=1234261 RepID=A0A8S2LSG1_9BILA|nr:unnamed protein product [Didymodactylos carnosus]CAF3916484.1 unnamed protein product [Didymodactylos carnosus]